ncbi:ShlB/FhaC/HecB family hemolysin secretion/activation protein [Dyella telluris]|uniref:ShlB/FhaC/HecB family hemolysin secretion/activation protein n=1 Tax=Dyella telluris TaxID=2763498 RepID=A0A7G8Q3B3_9GAMM|nr:ShlB/FhaC/HecB family hemolysin secretion/activation protein [Dyella telluris]QNK01271.1 ShlB/FhaC/HecB family hemolysin secretion/activation protein [Dyella telluris]
MPTKQLKTSHGIRLGAAIAIALSAPVTWAQNRPTPPPTSSGQLLQQVTRPPAEAPSSKLDLTIQPSSKESPQSTTRFMVRNITITGNTELPTDQLHAAVASGEGRELTLADLDALALRISEVYHQHGYPLATAYVPAQTIKDGVVRIDVAEARYGKVNINNQSYVSTRVLNATTSSLQPGQPVTEFALERSLLSLSDIPGANVNSTMRPGQDVGTSDLQVDVTPQPRFTGELGLDNFAAQYTGEVRGTGSLSINSPLGQGDLLDFDVTTSGAGMKYGRGEYRYRLNGYGTTFGIAYSGLDYRLGGDARHLDAHGTATVGSAFLWQPIIRNTKGNLYATVEYDHRRLDDRVDVIGLNNDRHINRWSATLAVDQIDVTGVTNARVTASYGRLATDNFQTAFFDYFGPQTSGSYTKFEFSISRLQQLDPANALYLGFTAQTANKNLDSSEQFFLGGPDSVRGYDIGVIAGSIGSQAAVEYRHDQVFSWSPGVWQFTAFFDTGRVEIYENPFLSGINSARLDSVGLGANWSAPHGWRVAASVATPVSGTPELLKGRVDNSTRFWVQVRKAFF